MHSLRHTLITALVAFGLMGPTAALAYANPEQKAKRIGTSVQAKSVKQRGKDVSWGMATTVVHAPLHVVEGIILDYSKYHEFFPHLDTSKVLVRRKAKAMLYLETKIMKGAKTLWAQVRVAPKHKEGSATRVIDARMIRGNMDTFWARWEFTPVRDGRSTLVSFRMLVDPDLPLPNALFNRYNLKLSKKVIRNFQKRVHARFRRN